MKKELDLLIKPAILEINNIEGLLKALGFSEFQIEDFIGQRSTYIKTKKKVNGKEYYIDLTLHEEVEGLFKEEWNLELYEYEYDQLPMIQLFLTELDKSIYIYEGEYLELISLLKEIEVKVKPDRKNILTWDLDELSDLISIMNEGNHILRLDVDEELYFKTKGKMNKEKVSLEDVLAQIWINGKELIVTDNEEDKIHKINLYKLQRAFDKMEKLEPQSHFNIIQNNYDLDDADKLLQIALFGEVVYG